jgi:tetratricopeptide (TPR) repeat protein
MPSLGDSTSPDLYEKTINAVDRALILDPRSAEAYSALCAAKLTYAHDLPGAEMACHRAMELDPNSPIVLQNYSFLLNCQGRFEEALQAITRALDVEPMSFLSQTQYAHSLHFARRYDEAYSQYVRLIELQPERMPTYEWLVRALEASGRDAEALEWLIKSLKRRNTEEKQIAALREAYQSAGWLGILNQRIQMNPKSRELFSTSWSKCTARKQGRGIRPS